MAYSYYISDAPTSDNLRVSNYFFFISQSTMLAYHKANVPFIVKCVLNIMIHIHDHKITFERRYSSRAIVTFGWIGRVVKCQGSLCFSLAVRYDLD